MTIVGWDDNFPAIELLYTPARKRCVALQEQLGHRAFGNPGISTFRTTT